MIKEEWGTNDIIKVAQDIVKNGQIQLTTEVQINEDKVYIRMTMTAPTCPHDVPVHTGRNLEYTHPVPVIAPFFLYHLA